MTSIQFLQTYVVEGLITIKERMKRILMRSILNRKLPSTEASPIVLINRFWIERGHEEQFLAQWKAIADYMIVQPGFLSAQMHQNLAYRREWVNYALWKNAASFRAAMTTDSFQRLSKNLPAFAAPSFYELWDSAEENDELS